MSQHWRYIPNHWHEITRGITTIGLPGPLSTARSLLLAGFGMDDRVIDILAALCVALVVAVAWFVAQYVFGVSSRDIRISALTGAAIFALLMAPVWFGKKIE